MFASSPYEVNSEPGLGCAVVLGIKDTVVQGVPFFTELGGQRVPKFTFMDGFGMGNIFEDEVVRP